MKYSIALLALATAVYGQSSTVVCTEYVDGQPQCSLAASSAAPVCTEYVDGQPQCSSAAPVETSSAAPVCTEYVDGQPQCSSAAPVPTTSAAAECTEYVDGQPQCSSAAPAPVCTEYVDGQPQCSSAAPAPTGYYPTGGSAAYPTGTGVVPYSSYAPPAATGAAAIHGPAAGLLAAAGIAVAMF